MQTLITSALVFISCHTVSSGCKGKPCKDYFPVDKSNVQCWGLSGVPSASDADSCRQACCDSDPLCDIWQWCPDSSLPCATKGCWAGPASSIQYCKSVDGWVSAARDPPPGSEFVVNATNLPPAPVRIPAAGTSKAPASKGGVKVGMDSLSWTLGSSRWVPVHGSLHFARLPANEWRTALLRMRAGGLDSIQTYQFWLHSEEEQNKWRWDGRRSLDGFLNRTDELGLGVLMRGGPWSHGEARGGGFPDWLQALASEGKVKLRSTDPKFLALATLLYQQEGEQIQGHLWKDGGGVFSFQVDNEYCCDPQYLLALKKIALQQAGIDAPYFLKTEWPTMQGVPYGELVPNVGVYVSQFWPRNTQPDPPSGGYLPSTTGFHPNGTYPQLEIEVGDGMSTAYHRRVVVPPSDIGPVATVYSLSGTASGGYYIYQGSVNPIAKLSYMQEAQYSGGSNDMPVLDYDYYAPLGSFHQVREHYHSMRRLHLLLHSAGPALASLTTYLPTIRPTGTTDTTTLRWAVRANPAPASGTYVRGAASQQPVLLGINSYGRGQSFAHHDGVRLTIHLPGNETRMFPPNGSAPLSIAPGAYGQFIMGWDVADLQSDPSPIRTAWEQPKRRAPSATMGDRHARDATTHTDSISAGATASCSPGGSPLGAGVVVSHATAQPLFAVCSPGNKVTVFLTAIEGIYSNGSANMNGGDGSGLGIEVGLEQDGISSVVSSTVTPVRRGGNYVFPGLLPGLEEAIVVKAASDGAEVAIVVLDEPTGLATYRERVAGVDTAIVTRGAVIATAGDSDQVRIQVNATSGFPSAGSPSSGEAGGAAPDVEILMLPAPTGLCMPDAPGASHGGASNPGVLQGSHYPKGAGCPPGTGNMEQEKRGAFTAFIGSSPAPAIRNVTVNSGLVRRAGPARHIPIGPKGAAAEPRDADFNVSAEFEIDFYPHAAPAGSTPCSYGPDPGSRPAGGSCRTDVRMVLPWWGDVVRAYYTNPSSLDPEYLGFGSGPGSGAPMNGVFMYDQQYAPGIPLTIGFNRFAHMGALREGSPTNVLLQILPWQRGAPIYLDGPQPPFPSGFNTTLGMGDVAFEVEQDIALQVLP